MRNGDMKSARQFGPKMIPTIPRHHREGLQPLIGIPRVESEVDMLDCEGDQEDKTPKNQDRKFGN